jgi:putative endonuclease
MRPEFYTYILTNADRTVLYIGMTNNLPIRLMGHWISEDSFSSQYHVQFLVWYESTRYVLNAIAREKELKTYLRIKKDALITEANPEWRFLNAEIVGVWPPTPAMVQEVKELNNRDPNSRWR